MKQLYSQLIFSECIQDMQKSNRWAVELMDANETGIGGFKEVVFMIKGQRSLFKTKI